jgi:uncharacterized protein YyaL (SSP411 family)
VQVLLDLAKKKMYAARLQRPTPYVDKTVYVAWNAMCISAYLEAAKALDLDSARRFALRSLDRILAEGWSPENGLLHVLAYSDPQAEHRRVPGVLDDCACTVIACLDAYEATADLTYFSFAQRIADVMVDFFYDGESGGFFDIRKAQSDGQALGVLGVPRKPFQDSPTPAGNSVAAIALLRLYAYTGDASYREKAQRTIESFAGVAAQYGMFAATYALAGVQLLQPHTQVVIIGKGDKADELYRAANHGFSIGRTVLKLNPAEAVARNLPPSLGQTIPRLPSRGEDGAIALLCSENTCEAPIQDAAELRRRLRSWHTKN